MKDKRFLVFDIVSYYPQGGMGDMITSFDTMDELYQWLNGKKYENRALTNYHHIDSLSIYDRVEGVEVDYDLEKIDKRVTWE
jgi:hypothetical protein